MKLNMCLVLVLWLGIIINGKAIEAFAVDRSSCVQPEIAEIISTMEALSWIIRKKWLV